MHEPLAGLFRSSKVMILNFHDIPAGTPPAENIQLFFEETERAGQNPRLPENRQQFNNRFLEHANIRYLVSRYGEDRAPMLAGSRIASEGRTLHMGIDIFCRDLETVYAPCDGQVVRTAYEPGEREYGHYVIFRPDGLDDTYFFFGHLAKDLPEPKAIKAGQPLARLGDWHDNENGGWSRHLHLQVFKGKLPPDEQEVSRSGYATNEAFAEASKRSPNPLTYFPEWKVTA